MLDIIEKTRDKIPLSQDDIHRLVNGIVDGAWPDYQLAAWLMAVVLSGLTRQETFWLTGSMAFSSGEPRPLGEVDKHSTGGVGDKTTLVLAPLVASLGLSMAKMSGRGLGHTGGTLDKLESIPGFRTQLDIQEIRRQVEEIGVAVVAQSQELAPADRRLYALRDVTATVNSLPLIASSIMAKKLAAGTPHLVLDVKVGSGAFMNTVDQATDLATLMVDIGRYYGRRVTALITGMQQPLGWAVGNAIEVNEAMACLMGEGPSDLREEVIRLAAELLHLARGTPLEAAIADATRALEDGQARERFLKWVERQGGPANVMDRPLPLAPLHQEWRADRSGTVTAVNARLVGQVALDLGAGRHRLEDAVDPAVGIEFFAKIGRRVKAGEVLGVVYGRASTKLQDAISVLQEAVQFGDDVRPPALVLARIGDDDNGPQVS